VRRLGCAILRRSGDHHGAKDVGDLRAVTRGPRHAVVVSLAAIGLRG
jgi:hypothetical protein